MELVVLASSLEAAAGARVFMIPLFSLSSFENRADFAAEVPLKSAPIPDKVVIDVHHAHQVPKMGFQYTVLKKCGIQLVPDAI